jgi:hypothetical protein
MGVSATNFEWAALVAGSSNSFLQCEHFISQSGAFTPNGRLAFEG